MSKTDWKDRLNVVYSTNPNFEYETGAEEEVPTLAKDKQLLRIQLDKRLRKGKTVSLVTGFVGAEADLRELGRWLKVKCGVGGSTKEGEIVIQGDFRQRLLELLHQEGYSKARII